MVLRWIGAEHSHHLAHVHEHAGVGGGGQGLRVCLMVALALWRIAPRRGRWRRRTPLTFTVWCSPLTTTLTLAHPHTHSRSIAEEARIGEAPRLVARHPPSRSRFLKRGIQLGPAFTYLNVCIFQPSWVVAGPSWTPPCLQLHGPHSSPLPARRLPHGPPPPPRPTIPHATIRSCPRVAAVRV